MDPLSCWLVFLKQAVFHMAFLFDKVKREKSDSLMWEWLHRQIPDTFQMRSGYDFCYVAATVILIFHKLPESITAQPQRFKDFAADS